MGKVKSINSSIQSRKRNLVLHTLGIVLLVTMYLIMPACDPGGSLTIENRNDQEVKIYFSDLRGPYADEKATYQATILPNEKKEMGIVLLGPDDRTVIEAKDLAGETVFSRDYNRDDLEKIGWKIVISPESDRKSSDNTTLK